MNHYSNQQATNPQNRWGFNTYPTFTISFPGNKRYISTYDTLDSNTHFKIRYLYSIEVESNKLEKYAYFTVSPTDFLKVFKKNCRIGRALQNDDDITLDCKFYRSKKIPT